MGDGPAPQTQESMQDIMQALIRNLPAYMNAQNSQVGPQAATQLAVAKQISPEYAKLNEGLYSEYAPKLAETGAKVENINRTNAARTDLDILKGSGGALATEAQRIDRILNPEFYNTREATANKLGELLSSINLNDANPEAERLINQENVRSGNLGNDSATSTVSNALSFGGELQKRRDSLGQALSVATQALQPMQGNFNPVVTALGRPSSNSGQSQFTGIQNPSSQAYQSGSQVLGSATAIKQQENDINANRRDALDRFNEVLTGVGSIVSV